MIEIKDVHKSFSKLKVLQGLNLVIVDGETIVILGRSGEGKSVLLKHILGLLKPDSGEVLVDGVNIPALRGRSRYHATKNMGMLFQNAALFDSMNVADNTAFYMHHHPDLETGVMLTKGEINDRVDEALAMVNLKGTQKKMPSGLSGGMKKRAALARLIVYRPKILLYDEPTTGLDPITAMHINELIIKIQHELEATSIVVTHDIISALKVGDRLALQDGGVITHLADKESFVAIDDPVIQEFLHNAQVSEGASL